MGLDMFLTTDLYFSKYSSGCYQDDEAAKKELMAVLDKLPLPARYDELMSYDIEAKVGYWRKANAIHNWIVQNVADGVDECQKISMPRDSIQALYNTCNFLLEKRDPEQAAELLPTQSGFFFGSTEYDDFYWGVLEYTRDLFKKLLDEQRPFFYYYKASW
jgi:hypothetical protein